MCIKVSLKIHTLALISSYISINKLRLIMHVFFSSQFGYCLLVWLFHFRSLNNQLNKLKEKVLRPVCKDTKSYFGKLLKNFQQFFHILSQFIIEILKNFPMKCIKVKHKIVPKLMCEYLFEKNKHPYNLRNGYTFRK